MTARHTYCRPPRSSVRFHPSRDKREPFCPVRSPHAGRDALLLLADTLLTVGRYPLGQINKVAPLPVARGLFFGRGQVAIFVEAEAALRGRRHRRARKKDKEK